MPTDDEPAHSSCITAVTISKLWQTCWLLQSTLLLELCFVWIEADMEGAVVFCICSGADGTECVCLHHPLRACFMPLHTPAERSSCLWGSLGCPACPKCHGSHLLSSTAVVRMDYGTNFLWRDWLLELHAEQLLSAH